MEHGGEMAVGNAAIARCLKSQGYFIFRAFGLLFEIHFIRCPIIQSFVESFRVVETEVLLQVPPCLGNRRVLVKVNLLIFDATPETFDKNIVEGAPAAVHADFYVLVFQHADERRAGKLNALISIHNVRLR